MISFKEAQEIINSLAASFGTESVNLDNAMGRVLAETVLADRDYPDAGRRGSTADACDARWRNSSAALGAAC